MYFMIFPATSVQIHIRPLPVRANILVAVVGDNSMPSREQVNNFKYSKTCFRDHLSSETTSHLRPQFGCTNSFFYTSNLSSETTL